MEIHLDKTAADNLTDLLETVTTKNEISESESQLCKAPARCKAIRNAVCDAYEITIAALEKIAEGDFDAVRIARNARIKAAYAMHKCMEDLKKKV